MAGRDDRRRYRRRRKESRTAGSTVAWIAALVAAVCVLLFFVATSISASNGGENGHLLGSLAMASFLGSLVCLYFGIREFRNVSYSTASRVVGLLVPIAAVILWGGTFAIGLLL